LNLVMIGIAVVFGGIILCPAAWSQPPADPPPPPGGAGPLEIVANILGLAPDQVHAWADLLQAREAAVRPLAEQVHAREESLRHFLESPQPDPMAVGALVLEIRGLHQEIGRIAERTRFAMQQILTADQHERLERLRQAAQVCPAVPPLQALGLL
jgi:Spy/CpxP family protein refolding chaperone